ncbi:MAG TPA: ERCC4 domain-containing protein [Candidatus Limnocylindria bacterium]|nr:ERCC4 domain-containing protein [Candidatus Limnocylindria bacterium]
MADVLDDRTAFWIGRNPATASRLPYLLRLPVSGEGRVFLAARETWPRGKDVFCYQLREWPPEAEIVERVPVEACWRQGAAIHLVLRRRSNRRSLFVWTRARGREVVFWRSAASLAAARPGIRAPAARGLEGPLAIAVDSRERYPWRFAGKPATLERRDLPVGDYAIVEEGRVVAAVERKRIADLATAAVSGGLRLAVAELARLPHGAIAVEGRWSDLLKVAAQAPTRAGWLVNVVVGLQVEHPGVLWSFSETPALAQDWAYRWLAACAKASRERYQIPLLEERAIGDPLTVAEPPAGARILDAAERRALIVREARAGTAWTSRLAAGACGVTQATAAADLAALVRAGELRVQGAGRSRHYVVAR